MIQLSELVPKFRPLYLRIATVNVSGWSPAKAIHVKQIIERNRLELLIITETRNNLDLTLPGTGRPIIVRGVASKKTGVALAKPIGKEVKIVKMTERIIHISHPSGVQIVGGYGPTEQATEREKTEFWSQVYQIIQATAKSPTILLGDFNAGNEVIRHPAAMAKGKSNYDLMVQLIQRTTLELQEHGPTWISPCAAASNNIAPSRTLDRCLVSSMANYSATTKVDFTSKPADHATLLVNIHFLGIDRSVGRPRNRESAVMNEKWMKLSRTLRQHIDQTPTLYNENEFWKAKQHQELEDREELHILTTEGKQATNEEAVILIAEYLKQLWGQSAPVNEEFQPSFATNISQVPTKAEVEEAIQRLKTDVTQGRDRINPTNVKSSPVAVEIYHSMFQSIWESEKCPQPWKDLRVKPVPKTTTLARANETRPITCVAVSAKILNEIIMARNRPLYEAALHTNQHAYRQAHSVETAVQQLISTIEDHNRRIVAFLDISKAYDSVPYRSIVHALERWKLPSKEANIILDQYRDCQVHVELNGYTAPPFVLGNGIRQGCGLSCMVFALLIAGVHDEVYHKMTGKEVDIISYSDDIIVASKDLITTKVVIKYIKEALHNIGLQLNEDKTTILNFDNRVNPPSSVKWLGIHLKTDLTWDAEAQHRLQKMRKGEEKITRVLMRKRLNLPMKDMIQVIQALVGLYARLPQFVQLSEKQDRELETELLRIVSKLTHSSYDKTRKIVTIMRKSQIERAADRTVACEFCSKIFRNRAGLAQHLLFCSSNPTPPQLAKGKCPQCNNEFCIRALQHHMKHCTINITTV